MKRIALLLTLLLPLAAPPAAANQFVASNTTIMHGHHARGAFRFNGFPFFFRSGTVVNGTFFPFFPARSFFLQAGTFPFPVFASTAPFAPFAPFFPLGTADGLVDTAAAGAPSTLPPVVIMMSPPQAAAPKPRRPAAEERASVEQTPEGVTVIRGPGSRHIAP
jgi:hypothetical protein